MQETRQKFEQQQLNQTDDFPQLWNKRSSTPSNIRDLNSGIKSTMNN